MVSPPHGRGTQRLEVALATRFPQARILRVLNSAFFGLPNKVTGVGHAVIMLGMSYTPAADPMALADHPDFTLHNPNRVRALYMAFAVNPAAFHAVDGTGYRMIADLILALDPLNPQTAARFVAPLGRWRRIEPVRSALMRAELERIAAAGNLSRDTAEQVARSLG